MKLRLSARKTVTLGTTSELVLEYLADNNGSRFSNTEIAKMVKISDDSAQKAVANLLSTKCVKIVEKNIPRRVTITTEAVAALLRLRPPSTPFIDPVHDNGTPNDPDPIPATSPVADIPATCDSDPAADPIPKTA